MPDSNAESPIAKPQAQHSTMRFDQISECRAGSHANRSRLLLRRWRSHRLQTLNTSTQTDPYPAEQDCRLFYAH